MTAALAPAHEPCAFADIAVVAVALAAQQSLALAVIAPLAPGAQDPLVLLAVIIAVVAVALPAQLWEEAVFMEALWAQAAAWAGVHLAAISGVHAWEADADAALALASLSQARDQAAVHVAMITLAANANSRRRCMLHLQGVGSQARDGRLCRETIGPNRLELVTRFQKTCH
jgi:hypothetical protein